MLISFLNANEMPTTPKDIIQYGYNYTGDLYNGKREGVGKYIYKNGDIYDGDWKNDLKNGEGTFTFKEDSHTYIGEFSNGFFD